MKLYELCDGLCGTGKYKSMKKALRSLLSVLCWYLFCTIVLSPRGTSISLPKTDVVEGKCGLRNSCGKCVPAGENDNHCVWCMSTSRCVSSLSVYKPKNITESRKCAGVVAKFSRCSTDPIDYRYLMRKRQKPALHPLLASKLQNKNSSNQDAEEDLESLYEYGGLKIKLEWPLHGARATRHTMPVLVNLEVGKVQAPQTTKLCYELTHVGNSHLSNAQNASCYSLNSSIPALQIPNRTGAFVMRLWATVNPDAKDAASGWRISDTKSVVLDSLRSEFYEDSVFSTNHRFPGFPYDTWADNSSLTRKLKDKLIQSNEQALARFINSKSNTTLLQRHFYHWNKPIPKILHQIWWQGLDDLIAKSKIVYGSDMYNEPDWRRTNFLKWSKTWKHHHPSWHYRLWDEAKIVQMIKKHFPDFLETFTSLDAVIKKIDFSRYLIMFLYGGVYVDMDFEAFRPIDPLIFSTQGLDIEEGFINDYEGPSVLLSEEGAVKTINCAVLASTPRHPFFWLTIHEVIRREDEYKDKPLMLDVLHSTGPVMLTNVASLYESLYPRSNVRVLRYDSNEVKLLHPLTADDLEVDTREEYSYQCTRDNSCSHKFPHSFAMHHFSGAWWPNHVKEMEKRAQRAN